jgi:hypothetical protein
LQRFVIRLVAGLALALTVSGDGVAQQPARTGVSDSDCKAFMSYVLDEARSYEALLSKTFLRRVVRFTEAGCRASDAQGEIELITETQQDAISFRTARGRMGRIDILSLSGVRHCHRPPNGACPARDGG